MSNNRPIGTKKTKEEITSLVDGSTLMVEIIPVKIKDSTTSSSFNLAQTKEDGTIYMTTTAEVIRKYSPLQKEDSFHLGKSGKEYGSNFKGRVIDISLKKVIDLTLEECKSICGVADYKYCYNILNERYIPIFPSSLDIALDNPYLFVYTIENLE